jgi:hypothetical protein
MHNNEQQGNKTTMGGGGKRYLKKTSNKATRCDGKASRLKKQQGTMVE